MPFARPTLTQRRAQAQQDILAAGFGPLMRRDPLRLLGDMAAGLAHSHDGHLDWIARQSNPFTCTGEHLEAWAALVGIVRIAAVQWVGQIALSGAAGTPVPAGAQFRRQDGGAYVTTADATLDVTGAATASACSYATGKAADLDAGLPLTAVSAATGLSASAGSTVRPAADAEGDDGLRARMLVRYRAPPQGALADYIGWALAVPGVTRAWANPLGGGAGTVVVYAMLDAVRAAQQGFPQGTDGASQYEPRAAAATGDQLAVADALFPLHPVTALVYACAPAPCPVPFAIRAASPTTAAQRAAAELALASVFTFRADPLGGVLPLSPFEAALGLVPTLPDFTLTSSSAPIQAPLGSLPVLGAVAWS